MANAIQTLSRFLTTLRNLTSDNGHTYYFASPGYCCSKVLTGGTAATITVPTDGNGVQYRAVALSMGGNNYYVNLGTTATGTGTTTTTGVADMESPAAVVLQNADSNTLSGVLPGAYVSTFSVISPNSGTLFQRYYN